MNDERMKAFTPRDAVVTNQPGSERAGGAKRLVLRPVRWMQGVLPMGNDRGLENEGGAGARQGGENPASTFGPWECVDPECGQCRRRRQAQQAEDVAVWGLLVGCLVGFGAAAVSQIWRVL